ncbi:hypothetical protein C8F04DRAFT_261153 [Mycena alexandri]|uniref:Uncharacterized protein n=1 Tax=Mycena alexandri TaxID=1745969 RepID=A0AAD6WQQ7_9AGAR|nr:hypothetical protein C8F04DRAFT_261153 [Mycena alexandri]
MVGQTARSWEARTGTAIPREKTSSNALSRAASSSTVVSFDNVVAPSDLEIYSQAGLIPIAKSEKAPERKARTDENELRISTHIVAILRRIEELERKGGAQHHEMLQRMEDVLANLPSSAPADGVAGLAADIESVRARASETRNAVTDLLGAVNNLMDVPTDIARLTRRIENLSANNATIQKATRDADRGLNNGATNHITHAATSPTQNPQRQLSENEWREREEARRDAEFYGDGPAEGDSGNGTRGATKRDRPFAGFGGASTAAKRAKTSNEPTYEDVYLWDVDTGEASPAKIAHTAMERLGMNSSNAFHSVKHAPNAPRSVISIRFRTSDVADQFIDNMRANAPASMRHLHAGRRAVYEKKGTGNKEKDPW